MDQLGEEPFFLTTYGLSVHHPFDLPADAKPLFPHDNFEHKVLNLLRYTDDSLKLFFELAQDKPWFKNSIIIITADNSQPAGGRVTNLVNYTNVYEENIWIPLLVIDNSQQQLSGERNIVASHIDIAPTILDYLGIDTINHFQGRSLLPDDIDYGTSFAFSSSPLGGCMAAYREGDYKLMSRLLDNHTGSLFDMPADKNETTNLRHSLPEVYDDLNHKIFTLYSNQHYLYENNKFWSDELQKLFEESL